MFFQPIILQEAMLIMQHVMLMFSRFLLIFNSLYSYSVVYTYVQQAMLIVHVQQPGYAHCTAWFAYCAVHVEKCQLNDLQRLHKYSFKKAPVYCPSLIDSINLLLN